ncbi:threonine ammonia-lyase [Leptothoe spongobia]|uniref:threonine ammonia-lyase n=1 Tax=Leptothoe spongobia TAU-MAC 1115 TaxID=1967444 RepID=A0A947DIC2_9CYAN|nr:pyridoxal-phosphate dependent enzyme [Leptothoe spongobia]MBT9317752.1 pyridoxal-phosphate dependent enzyme [Leptothoe spongobia TAU-MAC 1115]
MLKLQDFEAAQARFGSYIQKTPVSYHQPLDVYFKWENQQNTGSFKLRGALNKILTLSPEELKSGLVAASSGNHGKSLAYAAQLIGVTAHIFVPWYASDVKVTAINDMGAQVERVPGVYQDTEVRAQSVVAETSATYVSPYNDWNGIAGAGTIGLEWLAQTPQLSRLLIPVGAGALLVGIALAARSIRPDIEIVGIQAEASPYLHHQFYHGHMDGIEQHPTIMEGLAGALESSAITIDWFCQLCDQVILVTDSEVETAISCAYHQLGEVIEGSAAVGLAAVLAGKISTADKPTGVLITGGNIDMTKHQEITRKLGADQI